jgi:hypothetical protein
MDLKRIANELNLVDLETLIAHYAIQLAIKHDDGECHDSMYEYVVGEAGVFLTERVLYTDRIVDRIKTLCLSPEYALELRS